MQNLSAVPKHIAIIMDGNGRWAELKGKPRIIGHQQGLGTAEDTIKHCIELGIEALTLFAFSSENWQRPPDEVSRLMELFLMALKDKVPSLHQHQVQLRFVGDLSRFSNDLKKSIRDAHETTGFNTGLKLRIAANYGGRWDIAQAAQAWCQERVLQSTSPEVALEDLLRPHLSLCDLPDPDLFIRTGGERRISNFMLWQLAYTELYFTDVLWPDFDKAELNAALKDFATRQRRFGKTSEQIREGS